MSIFAQEPSGSLFSQDPFAPVLSSLSPPMILAGTVVIFISAAMAFHAVFTARDELLKHVAIAFLALLMFPTLVLVMKLFDWKIGGASCRERV